MRIVLKAVVGVCLVAFAPLARAGGATSNQIETISGIDIMPDGTWSGCGGCEHWNEHTPHKIVSGGYADGSRCENIKEPFGPALPPLKDGIEPRSACLIMGGQWIGPNSYVVPPPISFSPSVSPPSCVMYRYDGVIEINPKGCK